MANLSEQSSWVEGVYQIETTDPVVGGPDGISNIQAKQLGNRTKYLKDGLDQAQSDLESVGIEGQNALWSAAELALANFGLLSQELERNQTVRHQEGIFTLYNRGLKTGCDLDKSDDSSRNLSIDAGICFMLGREIGVDAEVNAAAVPSNSSDDAATALAYLYLTESGAVRLSVTELNQAAPDDALVLASLAIPADNTDVTDQYLDSVVITTVARSEPNWPSVQTDPAYHQYDFAKVMGGSDYHLSLDIVNYVGGQAPQLIYRTADRANNTFRVYGCGSADAVQVRFVAHLMNQ